MSLLGIAWRSIRQRALASCLTALSMGLGVMLVVAVLSIHGVVSESFRSNASLGYNMIVGAKGGKLQLTLNTVYYLSQPVENIPYEYYLEFLSAEQRQREEADPGRIDLKRAGRFGSSIALAIPVYFISKRRGYSGEERASARETVTRFKDASTIEFAMFLTPKGRKEIRMMEMTMTRKEAAALKAA